MKLIKFGICFCLAVFLFSCAVSSKITFVFDESIPVERSSFISAGNAGEIIGFNGIPVNWRHRGLRPDMIQIPAGNTVLEWNVYSQVGYTIYSASNAFFRYNFQPQKQYFFIAGRQDFRLGFYVYVLDYGEKVPTDIYTTKYFVAFVPFE